MTKEEKIDLAIKKGNIEFCEDCRRKTPVERTFNKQNKNKEEMITQCLVCGNGYLWERNKRSYINKFLTIFIPFLIKITLRVSYLVVIGFPIVLTIIILSFLFSIVTDNTNLRVRKNTKLSYICRIILYPGLRDIFNYKPEK